MKSALFLVLAPALAVAFAAASGCSSSSGNPAAQSDAGGDDGGTVDTGTDAGVDSADAADPSVAPITGVTPQTWTWVPIAGAICRDGTPTGIAVNVNPGATKTVLYLEGGGACFNDFTCVRNPQTFGSAEFDTWNGKGHVGLLDRTDAANAVK